MNPCKDEKCLKYPICIQQRKISCQLFIDHISNYRKEYETNSDCKLRMWEYIEQFLPTLQFIDGELK